MFNDEHYLTLSYIMFILKSSYVHLIIILPPPYDIQMFITKLSYDHMIDICSSYVI
jgi:hypothetical protein